MESLIFVVCGVEIGGQIQGLENDEVLIILLKSILLYVLLHVIRLITLALLFPILRQGKAPFNWDHVLALMISNVRGGIGIALALMIENSEGIIKDKDQRSLVMFNTGMVTLMTLLVNGSMIKCLFKKLPMSKKSNVQKKMMGNILKTFNRFTNKKIKHLQQNKYYGLVNWYGIIN